MTRPSQDFFKQAERAIDAAKTARRLMDAVTRETRHDTDQISVHQAARNFANGIDRTIGRLDKFLTETDVLPEHGIKEHMLELITRLGYRAAQWSINNPVGETTVSIGPAPSGVAVNVFWDAKDQGWYYRQGAAVGWLDSVLDLDDILRRAAK